ncbi:conserved hypothetical protein [Crenothrix polyspora]|uniref:Uncharacterized protein n=1 Tax=Crenothrix polyspora TaxID=360316 RepID=A0A1R4HBL6_9GAMM|nr:hypothetical protein [Crenothrix polyspora]SJM93431.1 conserved hypothetical protein [Crenothrix polyspora]
MLFGLACEGVTDQITLENILCGYFENSDLDEAITELQPLFDETDQKQGEGGWSILMKYLASARFRDDVLNTEFIILQIDSDIADKLGVNNKDTNGRDLPPETIVSHIKTKLIESINNGASQFYETHAPKIIFAICVHSLECWLVAHHAKHSAIHDCFDVLKTIIDQNVVRVAKKHKNYNKLSEPFLIRKNIDASAEKDASFHIFIQSLATIEAQVFKLTQE